MMMDEKKETQTYKHQRKDSKIQQMFPSGSSVVKSYISEAVSEI